MVALLKTVEEVEKFKEDLQGRAELPLIIRDERIITYFPIGIDKVIVDKQKNIYEYRYIYQKQTIALIDHETWDKHRIEFI